uniref:Uncharacterized protein n=1 Tax=viral metagenome TaxID=1070528 RepID=A0A6M3LR47_9ZZZZ
MKQSEWKLLESFLDASFWEHEKKAMDTDSTHISLSNFGAAAAGSIAVRWSDWLCVFLTFER